MSATETIWLTIGFLGQGLFFMRWVVQWFKSERERESTIPLSFWYLSLIGGLITLAYAIYRRDPVFIAGQGVGALVYIRNLMLIHRNKAHLNLAASARSSTGARGDGAGRGPHRINGAAVPARLAQRADCRAEHSSFAFGCGLCALGQWRFRKFDDPGRTGFGRGYSGG